MENLNLVELKASDLEVVNGGQGAPGGSRNVQQRWGATTQGELIEFFHGLADGLFGFD